MSYEMAEVLGYFLFGLKWLALLLAFMLLLLGIDDLIIDLVYWGRTIWRKLGVYRRNERADEQRLFDVPEKPLAIMIPAWHEVGVVGRMADLAARTLDYENYQIFVGTYPNDPDTQVEVDAVCLKFPNVHKVVCARPGPTSKADCLNNVIDGILRFEESASVEFAGFIMHDAEDVISALELRLFNYLLPAKDLIQVPVYPFPPQWYNFTAGHYIDEFAEQHAKDMVVREALLGQIPSAGVGTCFSRRAVLALLKDNDGIAFDVQSLTEDYEIGMRLAEQDMACIFARYLVRDPRYAITRETSFGVSPRGGNVICVREHFPRSFGMAVRQKSRWIIGIVFQGISKIGWSDRPLMNYFLWRDRRGGITNFVGLLVNIVLFAVLLMWLATLFSDTWVFPPLLAGSQLLTTLLVINGILLLNRLLQRFYFVTLYYGLGQGLLSAPRMLWSNVINFVANLRAIRQVLREGDPRRVAWDKTDHEFPLVVEPRQRPIGRRLVELGIITESQLDEVLLSARGRRLGRELLSRGLIHSHELARVLAEQAGLEWMTLDPFTIPPDLVDRFPAHLALRYCVLPVAEEGRTLVIAGERAVSQVSLGAISRQLKRPVICRIAPQGRVTVGLRYWYSQSSDPVTEAQLEMLKRGSLNDTELERFYRHQVLLGDLSLELGMLPPALFAQAMFDYEPENTSLGDHLVAKNLITGAVRDEAVSEQRRQQAQSVLMLEASTS